ncbi:alcohol dehydrogenase catalytic domain-containing protein [Yinghuangia seranimata]|uniref:alcohol dehydrogenase catalytic domain-containing protein n=1 Tax=Yinghuangia seranimata TaxID=408067 RepID=UPI00248BA5E9|nr:alcohol dehydrogenase catalytic domain-containing protein [Yinghuangia seranimata]MDI2124902.1 alcohol dehydrogenase catalytic domain-containing protein [Yinghuangia seranimata]
MRAAVLYDAHDLRIEEVPDPAPGPGEVLLRPRFTGLCGSDLHFWEGGLRQVLADPVILGHEFSAEVVEVGPEVADPRLRPGALVAVEPMWTCGRCAPCLRGTYNLCRNLTWHGLSAKGGGMSGLTVVRADMVHVLPEGLTAEQGALVEPVSVAHQAVTRAQIAPGGTALVLGAGPIGIATFLDLRARGVERVVVSEPSAQRREAIAALAEKTGGGAELVLDPAAVDVVAAVRELTGGDGADASIDAAGVEPAFHAGLAATRPGGRMVTVAVYMKPVTFHPMAAFLGGVDVVASCAYCNDFPAVIDGMVNGSYPLDGWVRPIPLSGAAEGFTALAAGRELKLLVDVQGS